MTVAIASYQRCAPLRRLVEGLVEQVRQDPELGRGLDIVVVLDGSTDGSSAMLRRLDCPVPLGVVKQRNAGLAAARNAGIRSARGELIWFLDDDLVPSPGLLALHRRAHPAVGDHVLVGPCVIPSGSATPRASEIFWQRQYGELASSGRIDRFDRFSAANTSASTALVRSLGGFDERFVGYGREDYEFGLRLLDRGAHVAFDPSAVAWHEQRRTLAEACANRRAEGRNVVRFARLHPDRADDILRGPTPGQSRRALGALIARTRPLLIVVGAVLRTVASLEEAVRRDRWARTSAPALAVPYLIGMAEADSSGHALGHLLGRPLRRPAVPARRRT